VSRLLGLDVGATHSRARLSVDGEVAAEAEAPGASVTAVGLAGAKRHLDELLTGLPLPRDGVDAVCVGSAGISVPGARKFLHDYLAPLTRTGTVLIVHDAMLVLPAAGLADGIAVICGTGSCAVGVYRGKQARWGGWGYLLGDEGGGYSIVRAAVRVLLDRRDRGLAPGGLGGALLAAAGAGDVAALQEAFYAEPHPRHWARHAPLVLDCPDPAVAAIRAEAALALAGLAAGAAGQLAAPRDVPVVLAGGLSGHEPLMSATRAALAGSAGFTDVRLLTAPPVAGAIHLAARAGPFS
jgi:N-acetylglucosamine kinase-like BadF-type ATPase